MMDHLSEHATSKQTDDGARPGAKRIKFDIDVYAKELPCCEAYEKSYMHRDVVSHVHVTKTQFVITASLDGVIKFWKKTANGIEFVKSFKSHLGPIEDMSITPTGSELASISRKDKSVKIFDIVNFDMINMLSLSFEPKCVEWINQSVTCGENLLISDSKSPMIHTFDARQSTNVPKSTIEDIHASVVCCMRMNYKHNIIVSVDLDGIFKYWRANEGKYICIKHPNATISHNTVIHDLIPTNDKPNRVHNITFSSDGEHLATSSQDRIFRVFKFKSGRLVREFDESLKKIEERHREEPIMSNMDFARRIALERELDRNHATGHENVLFDQSNNYLLFPTISGVKVCNWRTNKHLRTLGKDETNFRPLNLGLFQGLIYDRVVKRFNTTSMESGTSDPTLYCTSYKKNRFYCFSNRYFEEDITTDGCSTGELIKDRDIFNEKPTREEMMAAIEVEQMDSKAKQILCDNATIHTTMGDINLKLYPKLAPKACENFCTHAKNQYYNNHTFHRVVKQFMIQTGDPTGTGSGGESIWEEDFEDEFCDELKHDKPFVLSMANCGSNTNGSQFFITVAPCPFLDGKHTIFGRVSKGMDVCQNISKVKTDKKDKPLGDIKIININPY